MNAIGRLQLLTAQMHLEPAEDALCPKLSQRKQDEVYISSAALPNGKRISLLKTLLTSACERNCYYCPFRAGRDMRRATFKPDEFARVFMYMHKSGVVEGIFLSSGVVNAVGPAINVQVAVPLVVLLAAATLTAVGGAVDAKLWHYPERTFDVEDPDRTFKVGKQVRVFKVEVDNRESDP